MVQPLQDTTLIPLHSVADKGRGTLGVVEQAKTIPFEFKRIFYLYDLPEGVTRGQHAHRKQDQFLICMSGSIELSAVNRYGKKQFILSTPDQGLYFPPMTWLEIKVLETRTICLVISSGHYDENDYIRNYANFEALLDATK